MRKRFTCTTRRDPDQPVAANLLDRQFTAAAPNRRWVGDTTEFVIESHGKLYLAAILDLFSRFVVGWAISAVNDRHLTIKALRMALKRRCPGRGLLHHSDQGCTYTSEDYQAVLEARGITCSMSRTGNCYDNAVMESFFSTVKTELGEHSAPSRAAATPRWSCSTSSRCFTTSGAGTRRLGRSARPRSSDGRQQGLWTLPSLWTPGARPQGTWKTAKSAVSHSDHSHHHACGKMKDDTFKPGS